VLQVEDNGGVYFVPAFAGLYAPYWRDDARGTILGLTAYNNRSHIVRAALEATAFQIDEVVLCFDILPLCCGIYVDDGKRKKVQDLAHI
jgi:glycerol kinase